MSKVLKTLGKMVVRIQIANLVAASARIALLLPRIGAAAGPARTPTPLRGPARPAPAATPGGANRAHTLCPSVRPHAALSGLSEVEK